MYRRVKDFERHYELQDVIRMEDEMQTLLFNDEIWENASKPHIKCKYCGIDNLIWMRNAETKKFKLFNKQRFPHKCTSTDIELENIFAECVDTTHQGLIFNIEAMKTMQAQENKEVAGTVSNGRYVVGVRIIEGPKLSGGIYAFYAEPATKLYAGDLVVVNVKDTYSLGIVQIDELSESHLDKAHKWIVTTVDVTAHEARMAQIREKHTLEKAMDEMLQASDKILKYKMLAEMNPKMGDMYKRMCELDDTYVPLAIEVKPEGDK